MDRDQLRRLVDQGDLDGLVRAVDAACTERDWAGLLAIRSASRHALDRGHQLWPVASLAEYRVALLAPGPFVGEVVAEGAGQHGFGPLSEVAATRHAWAELAPHLSDGPLRAFTAHERVLRGEDLTGDRSIDTMVLDLPLRLEPWEPEYALAEYEQDEARFPPPPEPAGLTGPVTPLGPPGAVVDDPESVRALRELVRPWCTQSNGHADAVVVAGDEAAAVGALGHAEARMVSVPPATALAWMAWAAASGGAHGRRRGGAAGRFGAWWALATVAGLHDDWPVPPGELGEVAEDLRFGLWSLGVAEPGWHLRLTVADPHEGWAWALDAHDHVAP